MGESEMIERVATALRLTNANSEGMNFTELTKAMARAAIEAMRLPAGASSVVGGLAIEESMFACEDTVFHGAVKCWNAMIDEAISDG